MFHLTRADSKGKGTEGSVGGGVGVATDDCHPRLGDTELGTDPVSGQFPDNMTLFQRLDATAIYTLAEGDCVTFDADLPHHFENPGPGEARFLAVTSAGLRRS